MTITEDNYRVRGLLAAAIVDDAKTIHEFRDNPTLVSIKRDEIRAILECCDTKKERRHILTVARLINNGDNRRKSA